MVAMATVFSQVMVAMTNIAVVTMVTDLYWHLEAHELGHATKYVPGRVDLDKVRLAVLGELK